MTTLLHAPSGGIDGSARLVPRSARRPGAVLPIALILALLAHLLLATAFIVLPPHFLAALAHPSLPPREATVDLVQNAMPTEGDEPVGGTGHKLMSQKATHATPPGAPPGAPPDQAFALPAGPDRTLQRGSPSPRHPTPKPGPAKPDPSPEQPEIRLDQAAETAGLSGGDATQDSTPDPHAHNHLPAYPAQAAERGEQGTVVAMVEVRPDGSPAAVVVVQSSGWPLLDDAAVRAVQHWRFRPAQDHGQPVAAQVPVRMRFSGIGQTGFVPDGHSE